MNSESDAWLSSLPSEADSTLRVRLDPSGAYAATSGSDRGVRLHDLTAAGTSAMSATAYGHSVSLFSSSDCLMT